VRILFARQLLTTNSSSAHRLSTFCHVQVVVVAAGATSSTRLAQLSVGSIPALLSSQPKDWVTLRSSADIQVSGACHEF
jgi:hypothetical protein